MCPCAMVQTYPLRSSLAPYAAPLGGSSGLAACGGLRTRTTRRAPTPRLRRASARSPTSRRRSRSGRGRRARAANREQAEFLAGGCGDAGVEDVRSSGPIATSSARSRATEPARSSSAPITTRRTSPASWAPTTALPGSRSCSSSRAACCPHRSTGPSVSDRPLRRRGGARRPALRGRRHARQPAVRGSYAERRRAGLAAARRRSRRWSSSTSSATATSRSRARRTPTRTSTPTSPRRREERPAPGAVRGWTRRSRTTTSRSSRRACPRST